MIEIIKQSLRWLVLIILQIIIFNRIGFNSLFNPFIYIFFVLMLPLATPRSLLLLLAFVTGLTVDIFSNTGGLHAFSATLIAFIRPYWIKIAIPRSNYDELSNIKLKEIEFGQFIAYTSLLLLVHHFSLYLVESLMWSDLLLIIGKAFTNTLISLVAIIAFRYFDLSPQKKS
jgi:rod shape-determining protein MreD